MQVTRLRRRFSPLAVLTGLALSIGVLSGCTPTPEPTPTPTSAFASEEEAFAAAEETYRAYIEATNSADLEDPSSIEAASAYTTGEAKREDQEAFDSMIDQELTVSGQSEVVAVNPVSAEQLDDAWTVQIQACLDVSEVKLLRPDGTSAVSPDRPDVQNVSIELVSAHTSPFGMLISAFGSAEEIGPCD